MFLAELDTTAALTPAHLPLFYLILLLFIATTNWLPTYATQEQVLAKNMWTDHLLDVKNIQIFVYLNSASQESQLSKPATAQFSNSHQHCC